MVQSLIGIYIYIYLLKLVISVVSINVFYFIHNEHNMFYRAFAYMSVYQVSRLYVKAIPNPPNQKYMR